MTKLVQRVLGPWIRSSVILGGLVRLRSALGSLEEGGRSCLEVVEVGSGSKPGNSSRLDAVLFLGRRERIPAMKSKMVRPAPGAGVSWRMVDLVSKLAEAGRVAETEQTLPS